jgi:pyrimidine deaminase RibD-like protein
MKKAVELAAKSVSESGQVDPSPPVGVVIDKNGTKISSAYRGQYAPGNHAEKCAIEFADGRDLSASVVSTTLEPCSRLNSPKIACAQRLIDQGVSIVFIGVYNPNPRYTERDGRCYKMQGLSCEVSLRTSATNCLLLTVRYLDSIEPMGIAVGLQSLPIINPQPFLSVKRHYSSIEVVSCSIRRHRCVLRSGGDISCALCELA